MPFWLWWQDGIHVGTLRLSCLRYDERQSHKQEAGLKSHCIQPDGLYCRCIWLDPFTRLEAP